MPEALTNPANRFMTVRGLIARLTQQEDLNFLLTNRIPRAALTRFMGWFSKIENPLVRDALDRLLAAVFRPRPVGGQEDRVQEPARLLYARAASGTAAGRSRPAVVASPSDGIIGAFGRIADTELFQIKGAPYSLLDLLGDPALVEQPPQRPLRHAAADVEHVSPLPRAV